MRPIKFNSELSSLSNFLLFWWVSCEPTNMWWTQVSRPLACSQFEALESLEAIGHLEVPHDVTKQGQEDGQCVVSVQWESVWYLVLAAPRVTGWLGGPGNTKLWLQLWLQCPGSHGAQSLSSSGQAWLVATLQVSTALMVPPQQHSHSPGTRDTDG